MYVYTFFQIGTDDFIASIQYSAAAIADFLCGDDTAIITLASLTGTRLRINTNRIYNLMKALK